jgi:hypothetical protein
MALIKILDKQGRVKFIQGDDDPEPLSIETMIENDINQETKSSEEEEQDNN